MARRRFIRAMMMPPSEDETHADEASGDVGRSQTTQGKGKPSGFDTGSSSVHGGEEPPWTEEDVMILLMAMINFMGRMGKDPLAEIDEFLPFMGMRICFPISKSDLLSKIVALRLQYHINIAKGDKLSLEPFESEVFRLSRMIWGAPDPVAADKDGPDPHGSKPSEIPHPHIAKNSEIPDQQGPKFEGPDCPVLLHELVKLCKEAGLGFGEGYLRARIAKVEERKVISLEKRWKKQKLKEASIRARKAALEHRILKALMR